MSWETVIYKRDELYDQVWARPLRDLAAEQGISDVALAKICKKLGVSRPGRGYWARKAAGKKVKRCPLPPKEPGQLEQFGVSRWKDPLDQHGAGAEAEFLLFRESEPSMTIEVPEELERPHPWVRKSAGMLRRHSKNPQNALLQRACLDIRVSKESLSRALLVADTLLKALKHRDFPIEVTEPVLHREGRYAADERILPSKTGVRILGSLVEFALVERTDSIKIQPEPRRTRPGGWMYTPPAEYQRRPNGKLALEIHKPVVGQARRTWCDGKRQKVENCLGEFIVALIKAAERDRILNVERERLELAWAEARDRREEQERLEATERQQVARSGS